MFMGGWGKQNYLSRSTVINQVKLFRAGSLEVGSVIGEFSTARAQLELSISSSAGSDFLILKICDSLNASEQNLEVQLQ